MVAGETRMIALPEWHPMAVHFPLALTVTGALALEASIVEVRKIGAGCITLVAKATHRKGIHHK